MFFYRSYHGWSPFFTTVWGTCLVVTSFPSAPKSHKSKIQHTPWNEHSPKKWWFPIGISFSRGLFFFEGLTVSFREGTYSFIALSSLRILIFGTVPWKPHLKSSWQRKMINPASFLGQTAGFQGQNVRFRVGVYIWRPFDLFESVLRNLKNTCVKSGRENGISYLSVWF